jgi:DNA-binding GntR family transcriptional regulator
MARSTAADHVFETVVSDILAGALRPRDRISERDLVNRFGVSRTPVREAIKRLLERGLVEPGPKGVAVVVEIAGEDLHMLYALRQQLESAAASSIAANITPAELAELQRINRRFKSALSKRDLVGMLEIRAEFHATLVGATRNRWLAEIMTMLRDRAYMVLHFHWQDADRAAQTVDLDDQMIESLRRRYAREFRELVVRQIRSAIECYDRQLRAPTPRRARPADVDSRRAPPIEK